MWCLLCVIYTICVYIIGTKLHGKKTLQDMYKIWLSYGDTIYNDENDNSDNIDDTYSSDDTDSSYDTDSSESNIDKLEKIPMIKWDLFLTCPNELLCLIATYLGSNAHRDRLNIIKIFHINIDGPEYFVQHLTTDISLNFGIDTVNVIDKSDYLTQSFMNNNTIIYCDYDIVHKYLRLLLTHSKIIITNNQQYNDIADYTIKILCDKKTMTSYVQYIYKCTKIIAKQIIYKLDIQTIIENEDCGLFETVFDHIRYKLAQYPSATDLINN